MQDIWVVAAVAGCVLSGLLAGNNIGKNAAYERIAEELARQQILIENKAAFEQMREVEARQEQIRQERLRWIENIGKGN